MNLNVKLNSESDYDNKYPRRDDGMNPMANNDIQKAATTTHRALCAYRRPLLRRMVANACKRISLIVAAITAS